MVKVTHRQKVVTRDLLNVRAQRGTILLSVGGPTFKSFFQLICCPGDRLLNLFNGIGRLCLVGFELIKRIGECLRALLYLGGEGGQ